MSDDMLVLVLKLTRENKQYNHFGIDDISALRCVSKTINKELDDILDVKKQLKRVWRNTAGFLGFDSDYFLTQIGVRDLQSCNNIKTCDDKVVLNSIHGQTLIRTVIKVRRLVFKIQKNYNPQESKVKLATLLNELTFKTASQTFTKSTTLKIQSHTIQTLIILCASSILEMRILGCYYTYYYLFHLYKYTKVVNELYNSVLASDVIKRTAIDRATKLKEELRNEIMMLPYGFIEKIIRLLGQTSNALKHI